MALIKCPECGHMVSPNAISCPSCGEPIAKGTADQVKNYQNPNVETDSGTETFSITEKNRLSLQAATNAKVKSLTAQLSAQGKMVVNVTTSNPQPITLGVTVWTNNTTVVWQARLDNPQYLKFLYDQAQALYSNGRYVQSRDVYKRLGSFQDAQLMAQKCTDRLTEIQKAKEAEQRAKEEEKAARLLEKEKARAAREAERNRPLTEEEKKEKQKKNKRNIIAGIVAILLCAFLVVYITVISPMMNYDSAVKLLESGEYDKALETFASLGEYKDSKAQIQECLYRKANQLKDSGKYYAAYKLYEDMLWYKDVSSILSEDKDMASFVNKLDSFSVGNTAIFGKYEQDAVLDNGKEELEWIVVKQLDDTRYMIPKYIIDWMEFLTEDEKGKYRYENSFIRSWLHTSFVDEAFSPDERNAVLAVDLLDASDIELSDIDKEHRVTTPTAYVEKKAAEDDAALFGDGKTTEWMTGRIRQPGSGFDYHAEVINEWGSAWDWGPTVWYINPDSNPRQTRGKYLPSHDYKGAVRPIIKIDLSRLWE